METEVTKRLFTVDEYYKMAKAGILTECDRVELIDGEIIEMSPISYRHGICVARATTLFIEKFGRGVVTSAQNPLRFSKRTEPQPDVIIYKPRADFYATRRTTPDDVLVLIEVADSSLSYDREVKLPLYAAAGISEYWIEDLQHDLLHVFRGPRGNAYDTVITLRPGDAVSPAAFPNANFSVEELLSTDCTIK